MSPEVSRTCRSQRLHGNQPLTTADLVEMERMLVDAGGTKSLIEEAKEKGQGLGLFIRREPDAGDLHVRFDEGDVETEPGPGS